MSNISPLLNQSLAAVVTADARTAGVFDRLGLDYCCRGHRTLEEAAVESGVPVSNLLTELDALGPATAKDLVAAEDTALDALTAHIVTRHHGYVRETIPVISAWLDKLAARRGELHPELLEVRATFGQLAEELMAHMMKEENILFPFINAAATAARAGLRPPAGPFGTIANPIRMMESDHEEAGRALERLRTLTNGYAPPADACTTYRLCYDELARFEADLHRHVHLENHVLFPRAVELEHAAV